MFANLNYGTWLVAKDQMTLEERQDARRLLENTTAAFKQLPHLAEDCGDGLPCACGRDDVIAGAERYWEYLAAIWDDPGQGE